MSGAWACCARPTAAAARNTCMPPSVRFNGAGSRTSEPLSTGRQLPLSVHRRRDWHYADLAHDRGGRGGGRRLRLFYGGRERASMAFVDELASYGDRVTIVPQDEMGMLDLESVLGTPHPDTLVYCCGPEGLLSAVEKFCENWPPGALHLERFSAKPQERPEADSSFELVLERGVTLQVPPDKSVLDVIEPQARSVLASCLEESAERARPR